MNNEDKKRKKDDRDLFDRTFVGSPGVMIRIIL
ncbi:hypothetical protein MEZE111188_15295 [Mesobacillus zeae]